MKKTLLLMLLMVLIAPWAANAQQSLPYAYGFENNDLEAEGWTAQVTSSSSGIYNAGASTAYEGTYLFRFNYSETDAYLVSPLLTGTDAGVNLSFYYKESSSTYGDEQFYVGYTTDDKVMLARGTHLVHLHVIGIYFCLHFNSQLSILNLFINLPSLSGTQHNCFSFRLSRVVHDLPYSLHPPFRLPLVSPLGRTSRSLTNKSLFFSFSTVLLISSAKVETIFGPRNSRHTHSETVRKNQRAIRKILRKIRRKTSYFRPFIKLKKRFTMLFLRVVSWASLVSLNVQ